MPYNAYDPLIRFFHFTGSLARDARHALAHECAAQFGFRGLLLVGYFLTEY